MPAPVTGMRRMRNGWKTIQPARYTRDRKPRQAFELTLTEWEALGGSAPQGAPGERRKGTPGLAWQVVGATVPANQPDCAQLWDQVAERLNVVMLTINWPNPASLTFTAEPL